jgi:hypothetical protein
LTTGSAADPPVAINLFDHLLVRIETGSSRTHLPPLKFVLLKFDGMEQAAKTGSGADGKVVTLAAAREGGKVNIAAAVAGEQKKLAEAAQAVCSPKFIFCSGFDGHFFQAQDAARKKDKDGQPESVYELLERFKGPEL